MWYAMKINYFPKISDFNKELHPSPHILEINSVISTVNVKVKILIKCGFRRKTTNSQW